MCKRGVCTTPSERQIFTDRSYRVIWLPTRIHFPYHLSLSFSFSLPSPPLSLSLTLIARAHFIAIRLSLTLRLSWLPFFPSFSPLLSPFPARIIIDLCPRIFPGPSLHRTFVSSHSFSLSPSSVVRDNSLVYSLITLRVYTPARTK